MFLYFIFFISLYKYEPPCAKAINKSALISDNDAFILLKIFNNTSFPSSELVGHISMHILIINNS